MLMRGVANLVVGEFAHRDSAAELAAIQPEAVEDDDASERTSSSHAGSKAYHAFLARQRADFDQVWAMWRKVEHDLDRISTHGPTTSEYDVHLIKTLAGFVGEELRFRDMSSATPPTKR